MNNSTSTPSPGWPTRWPQNSFKTGPTLALLAGILALTLVVMVAGIIVLRFTGHSVSLVPALVLQLILEAALVTLILIALPSVSRLSLAELGFRMPAAGTVGFAALGAVIMALVVNGSASLIETIAHVKHEQQVVEMFRQLHDPRTILFFAIFAIVLGPIAEETIFRVFIFNAGMRRWGFWGGAAISGVLFGAAHGDLYGALPLALGGVILCGVYYRTRNAYASMITHGLFNSLTVALLIYAPNLAK